MDKINLANWNQIFEKTDQKIQFASGRYTDLHFRFEETGLASGFIQSVSTPGMQLTELYLNTERRIQLIEEPKETVESVFVLEGHCESRFQNISTPLQNDKLHHNLQYNYEFGGEHIINSPRFHALTITYDFHFLDCLFQSDHTKSIDHLANAIQQRKPWLANHRALSCRIAISEVIRSIQQCRFTGVTRYLFLESKMMELFVLQMEQVQEISNNNNDHPWTSADKDKLHAIKNYIENSFLETFSLKELTYRFGLNEFKLKKGYKQLFQTTIFGHVLQLRMQRARLLLLDKVMTVSEAAFFIGYDNVSSFCTAFKKVYGLNPGKYKLIDEGENLIQRP